MKKLVTAACALVAAAAMADVQSANVVGYTTATCTAGKWYMLGAQFEDVSSTANSRVALTLQDLVQGCTGVEYGDGSSFTTTAPQLQVWDATANDYSVRYYLSDGWYSNNGADAYAAGWCDEGGNLVSDEIPVGKAMWFKSPSGDTVKLLGAVIGGQASLACASGKWEMPTIGLPQVNSLNDEAVTWSGISAVEYGDGSTFTTTAPQIQLWDPAANDYSIRYYLSDGWYSNNGADAYAAGWCDEGGNLVDDSIPAGYGFWFKPTSAVTIQCASPIAD